VGLGSCGKIEKKKERKKEPQDVVAKRKYLRRIARGGTEERKKRSPKSAEKSINGPSPSRLRLGDDGKEKGKVGENKRKA